MDRCRRPWLVANRATLPQKWPPTPRNVADSCELTATTRGQLRAVVLERGLGPVVARRRSVVQFQASRLETALRQNFSNKATVHLKWLDPTVWLPLGTGHI